VLESFGMQTVELWIVEPSSPFEVDHAVHRRTLPPSRHRIIAASD
jgi:hypothetical protein